jgi:hypothetical protein
MRAAICASTLLVMFALSADALAAAPPCATGIKDMKPVSLVELFRNSKGKYKLQRKTGCLADVGGREVPAVLLELPAYTEPYAVRIAAMIRKDFVLPRITFLDENHFPTREVKGEQLTRRGGEVSTDVFINPENSSERYVLVHADPEAIGGTETRVNMNTHMATFPLSPAGVVGTWTSGSDGTQELKLVDSGQFFFTLIGDQWADLKKNKK